MPRLRYLALATLFVIAVTGQVTYTIDAWRAVQGEYPLAPERLTGYVLSVDDRTVRGEKDFRQAVRLHRPGDRMRIETEHGTREVVVAAYQPKSSPYYAAIAWGLMPWFSILLGFWVATVRPGDLRAWLILGILLGLSQISREPALEALGWGWVGVPVEALRAPSPIVWAVSMLLFGIYFPQRWNLDRKAPWAKWVVMAAPLWMLFQVVSRTVARAIDLSWEAAIPPIGFGDVGGFIAISPCISVFFASISTKYGDSALGTDDRRRLKLLYWGATAALTPLFLLFLYTLIVHRRGPNESEGILLTAALLAVAIFPLTLAYVVVVDRAMDVRMVVRQGLQYALATKGLRLLQAVLIMGAVLVAGVLAASPEVSRPRRLIYVALAVMVAMRAREGGERLRPWIDRRFFREAYNSEQILGELSEQVRGMLDAEALIDMVRRKISDSLHVDRVEVVLGEAQPAGAELVLPLAGRKERLGWLALGPKKSEEPYSAADRNLLQTVATQAGFALENARLSEAIAHEVAQRELLHREIEIAREVQQRLFPQNLPEVAALEYAGYCRPARGVGGDYYDFLALASGRLGLAIGDVSGKGVPAALLMASLQASVRGQSQGGSNVAELMTNVNKLVCDASPENRYATFFYGQFDPATRKLVYSNGGHNNPIVIRGADVLRLETGGPPVGLFGFSRYQQEEVQLMPGDVLVLFTDGVSEAENPAQEEFGEDALEAAVRECLDRPPSEMIQSIMSRADEFAAGAPQHDDMTLVVARVMQVAS